MAAYINKPKKNYNRKRQQNDLDKKKRNEIYNSSTWRNMRKAKAMENPICQICEMENKVSLTEDVHHLNSFTEYNGKERDAIAFDYNNLISVCKYHHNLLHHGFLKGATTLEEIEERIKNNEDKPL